MNRVPVKNEEIVWRNLDGEAVLLNPHTGKYFGMNAVGCSFWEKIDGHSTVAEIIDQLLEEYEVTRSVLEKDLHELIDAMLKKNIIAIDNQ
jgi:hypothetical protein